MQQGSSDWLNWRRQGIGSSDAPIIMGVSPWNTPYGLWLDKLGQRPEKVSNWAMQRGNALEPKARAYYEMLKDNDMPACLVESADHPFIRASLDGFDSGSKRILEIKCPGKDDHSLAMEGKIPEKYIFQLVHQLYAADALVADYLSFDGEKGVIVEFQRDAGLESILISKEIEFWNYVQSNTPPEMTERDIKKIEDPLFAEFKAAKAVVDQATAVAKRLADEIKAKYPSGGVQCDGYQLILMQGKVTVDYDKIPELKNIDLSQYTKKGKPSLTLRPKK